MNAENKRISLPEYWIAYFIITAGIILRIFYVFRFNIDTDEPQHLHIVWAWTKGLLQYKDVFDNHMPLFHILFAPILYLAGERAAALYYMRLAIMPLFILALICAYIIGRNLFSKRTALWSVALMSVYPAFFFCSLQFRADVLWMVLWLAGMAVLLRQKTDSRTVFFAGLFFGAAFSVSDKTILLIFSLMLGIIFNTKLLRDIFWRHLLNITVLGLTGFIIVPGALFVFFASQNALAQFVYCTITHNILSGVGHWREPWRVVVFLALLGLLFVVNRLLFQKNKIGMLRSVLFLSVVIYFLSLFSLWPIVTRQNFLPVYFSAGILIVSLLLKWIDRRDLKKSPVGILFTLSLLEIAVIFTYSSPWKNDTRKDVGKIEEILRLTDSYDWVMDQKGETVFRFRPYYYALESFTRERIGRGLMPDSIVDDLINKRCFIATNDISKFPWYARDFIERNYISVGYMRVVGKLLRPSREKQNVFEFEVHIPAYYAVIGEFDDAAGVLDGTAYRGPRFLDSGSHEFVPKAEPSLGSERRFALVWKQAVDRGFMPSFE